MSIFSEDTSSSSKQNKYTLGENRSFTSISSNPNLNIIHCEDSRPTPVSHHSYEYQNKFDSSSSRKLVSRSGSIRYLGPYAQRVLHSSISSLDDLSKYQLQLQHPQTPPPEQKKSKGFFERIRTNASRSPPASDPKSRPSSSIGNTPHLTRQTLAPETASANDISKPDGSRVEWEVLRLPQPPAPPFPRRISQVDLADRSDQVDPAASVSHSNLSNLQSYFPDCHSEPKSLAQTTSPGEPRQRHPLRDSILNPFLKVPHRRSTQFIGEKTQQPQHGSLATRSSNWHHNSKSVSQTTLITPEIQSPTTTKSECLDSSEQNSHCITQTLQPESQHMALSGGSLTSRKTIDTKLSHQLQQEARDTQPPSNNRLHHSSHQPPTPGLSPQSQGNQIQSHRAMAQRDSHTSSHNEHGQNAPAPPIAERDINENYKELVTKYKKVKGLYFEKTAQVEQLQNTLANQRLSQSRTSLDDSEYMTRFQRLEGAVTNLAFNIRKDWRTVPSWLSQYVNHDAIKIGKQEMTAVGRAVITRFLVNEVFSQTFHPGLPSELSRNLKTIEQNIRIFSPAHNNQEESEALTARVLQWRLTTLEGLKDVLALPESEENKNELIRASTENLTAMITSYLQEPSPPGLENSAYMIIELAVSIASNLPLESREICIIYPMPGSTLQSIIMKVEHPIPGLMETVADVEDNESGYKDENGNNMNEGVLQAILKENPNCKKDSGFKSKKGEGGSQIVRFSGFVGVEVRGRQVLHKAPVWTIA